MSLGVYKFMSLGVYEFSSSGVWGSGIGFTRWHILLLYS